MAGGPDLTSGGDDRGTVVADQAILTSQPLAPRAGYRIIAASGGLTAEERRELTRLSPSHASLIEEGAGASGLLATPLASGRFAIGVVRLAGREHTGRGGERVHTHFAILGDKQYSRFAANPLRVETALMAVVGGEPRLDVTERLTSLRLDARPPTAVFPVSEPRAESGLSDPSLLLAIVDTLLARRAVLLIARGHAREVLEWSLLLLPVGLRRMAGVSLGLRFAPARGLACTVLPCPDPATSRAVRGHPIQVLDSQAGLPAEQSDFGAWIDFCRRRWSQRRTTELHRLTGLMHFDAGPALLERAVSILEDRDLVDTCDAVALAELIARYENERFSPELERDLCDELLEAARSRQAALEAEAMASAGSQALRAVEPATRL